MNAAQEGRPLVVVLPEAVRSEADHREWYRRIKEARQEALGYYRAGDSIETASLMAADQQLADSLAEGGTVGWSPEDAEWNLSAVRDWLEMEVRS